MKFCEYLKIHAVQIAKFVVLAKKHAGRNGNLIINFAWPYNECGTSENNNRDHTFF